MQQLINLSFYRVQESLSAVEARPRLEDQISRLRNELSRLKENRRDVESWHSSSSSSDDEENSSAASRAREEAGRNKKLLLQTQKDLKVWLYVDHNSNTL